MIESKNKKRRDEVFEAKAFVKIVGQKKKTEDEKYAHQGKYMNIVQNNINFCTKMQLLQDK